MNPLLIVGQIAIPPAVMEHPRVVEAMAGVLELAQDELGPRVMATADSRDVELYGWGANIEPHADFTGYVYLVALNEGDTTVSVWIDPPGEDSECEPEEVESVKLARGTVVRLDDNYLHWTEDSGPRLAAFLGAFAEPCDEQAMAMLRAGVEALARGDERAPRVQPDLHMDEELPA